MKFIQSCIFLFSSFYFCGNLISSEFTTRNVTELGHFLEKITEDKLQSLNLGKELSEIFKKIDGDADWNSKENTIYTEYGAPAIEHYLQDTDKSEGAKEIESVKATDMSSRISEPGVWIASFVAMLIISSVGLLVVSAVPYLQKVSYSNIIQFLVALAVGSLTGDAMLHLLPHAIIASVLKLSKDPSSQEANEDQEKAGIFKGLVALSGIYFFFCAEKLVTLISDYRTERKADEEEVERAKHADRKPSTFNEFMTQEEGKRPSKVAAFNLPRPSIIPTGLSGRALSRIDNLQRYAEQEDEGEHDHEHHDHDHDHSKEGGSGVNTPMRKVSTLDVPKSGHEVAPVTEKPDNSSNEIVLVVPTPKPAAEKHEGKSEHGHGHSHEVPQSVMSVAWMVILGDGLHNFTDGLAIGAAFIKSTAGGISTALAVFCHELPHELGDFAVLLKTGMKVKQALMYNCLSSGLSVLGMLIGLFLGSVQTASYWVFGITAGIFVYVALVDMLPQLSSAEINPGESRITHFLIQLGGLTVGVTNMFLIAMFEDKMKAAFT